MIRLKNNFQSGKVTPALIKSLHDLYLKTPTKIVLSNE